ncbi:MAG TPA: hypothetical protein VKZ50_04460 [bacterium]|nr:hypothetical protein [bacterium]
MSTEAIATDFTVERSIYLSNRMRLLTQFPPASYVLVAHGRLFGLFPSVADADEHAVGQRCTAWLVKQLGDTAFEHEGHNP